MITQRRTVLKGSAAILALGCTSLSQLLLARQRNDDWPAAAFESESLTSALEQLLDGTARPNNLVYLGVPQTAINGAVVPIRVTTALPDVKTMAVLVPANQRPLILQATIQPQIKPVLSTRVKMRRSSEVVAVIETDSGIFSGRATVSVEPS